MSSNNKRDNPDPMISSDDDIDPPEANSTARPNGTNQENCNNKVMGTRNRSQESNGTAKPTDVKDESSHSKPKKSTIKLTSSKPTVQPTNSSSNSSASKPMSSIVISKNRSQQPTSSNAESDPESTDPDDSLEKKIQCANCTTAIQDLIHIRCYDCPDDLRICIQCFQCGAELGAHLQSHRYQVINPDEEEEERKSEDEEWDHEEDFKLLRAANARKMGNWGDIAVDIGRPRTDGPLVKEHFEKEFINGWIGRFARMSCDWEKIKPKMAREGKLQSLLTKNCKESTERMLLIKDAMLRAQKEGHVIDEESPNLAVEIQVLLEQYVADIESGKIAFKAPKPRQPMYDEEPEDEFEGERPNGEPNASEHSIQEEEVVNDISSEKEGSNEDSENEDEPMEESDASQDFIQEEEVVNSDSNKEGSEEDSEHEDDPMGESNSSEDSSHSRKSSSDEPPAKKHQQKNTKKLSESERKAAWARTRNAIGQFIKRCQPAEKVIVQRSCDSSSDSSSEEDSDNAMDCEPDPSQPCCSTASNRKKTKINRHKRMKPVHKATSPKKTRKSAIAARNAIVEMEDDLDSGNDGSESAKSDSSVAKRGRKRKGTAEVHGVKAAKKKKVKAVSLARKTSVFKIRKPVFLTKEEIAELRRCQPRLPFESHNFRPSGAPLPLDAESERQMREVGYDHRREEFVKPWMDDAEGLISRMAAIKIAAPGEDHDESTKALNHIKLARIVHYVMITRMRNHFKNVILEHGKIKDFAMFRATVLKMTKHKRKAYAKELLDKIPKEERLLLMTQQFLTKAQYDDFVASIKRDKAIKERIVFLQQLQREGETTLRRAPPFVMPGDEPEPMPNSQPDEQNKEVVKPKRKYKKRKNKKNKMKKQEEAKKKKRKYKKRSKK